MLRKTPFHARAAALCESHAWRRWAGHVVASSYELSHEHEYHAIRSAAALFDVSPLYKYRIAGRDAARLLDRVVTRNVATLAVGQVAYTPWCDARGKVLDDGTVARLEADVFRMTSAEPSLRWLEANAVGLDINAFNTCMNSGQTKGVVRKDVEEGIRVGVNATPTLVVNGRVVEGLPTPEQFDTIVAIEKQRAGK